MMHIFKTADHPQAAGRIALKGERVYTFRMPHENGDDYIEVFFGERGYEAIARMFRQMAYDDECDTDPACFI